MEIIDSGKSDRLVVNPRARLRLETQSDGKTVLRLTVSAPVLGRGLLHTVVDRRSEAGVFEALCAVAQGRGEDALVLDEAQTSVLRRLGFLVAPEEVPAPLSAICLLDDPPRALLPPPTASAGLGALRPNPTLHRAHERARVQDPGTGLVFDYRLGEDTTRALEDLESTGDAARLPPKLRDILATGWLIGRGEVDPDGSRRDAADAFQRQGYAVVEDLLPPAQIATLRRYYRQAVEQGYLRLGDTVARRYVAHNDPVAARIHQGLTDFVSRMTGRPVRPSYCYVGSYIRGAALAPHTDRQQCEYSISLTVDYEPARARQDAWPLYLAPRGQAPVAIKLAMGDGLLYRGRELTHYRERLTDGELATSVFLHYVDADFRGSLA